MKRRLALAVAVAALGLLDAAAQEPAPSPASARDPWQRLPDVLAGIRAPVFPERDFPVTRFGAVAGGTTDASAAFRAAIAACAKAGGGRVRVPPGVLVYAYGERNIAVTGKGTLDGQAGSEAWWPWKRDGHAQSQRGDRDRLFAQAEAGVPVAERVYGAGHYLRPQFVQPYRCENVLIEDALFDTGDDCIAIKSGRNADGRRLATPSERVVVRGCRMRAGHGGVTIGSEVSGGVRDVFVERSEMSSPELERGIRIKTNAMRGGVVENVFVRDVAIGETGSVLDVDMLYEEGAKGGFVPVVRGLRLERVTAGKARYAFFVRGLPGSPVQDMVVSDSTFRGVTDGSRLEHVAELVLRNVAIEPGPRGQTTRKE